MPSTDPLRLLQSLIQCPSVTPIEGGALDYLEKVLTDLGFTCHRLPFEDVDNLFAKLGTGNPHFCFAGHTDVVPPGHLDSWMNPPFQGLVHEDMLYGRGAVDMKGAIASFIAAIARSLKQGSFPFALSLLITGDEEGIALNGTQKVLKWLEQKGEKIDFCLVGEPSCQHQLGDTIKIGRRGSLNTTLTVKGKQGHVAYPERASNPISRLVTTLFQLQKGPEEGVSAHFDRTNLEVTSIDVGNTAKNVIPEQATAQFNIRFNDQHSGASLQAWIERVCQAQAGDFDLAFQLSGEAEFLAPNKETAHISRIIEDVTGHKPEQTTHGGTSDARFIRHYAPVIEFGLVGQTMHQVNECVALQDIELLTEIYQRILQSWPPR